MTETETETMTREQARALLDFHRRRRDELARELRGRRADVRAAYLSDGRDPDADGATVRGLNVAARALVAGRPVVRICSPTRPTRRALLAAADHADGMAARPIADHVAGRPGAYDAAEYERDGWRDAAAELRGLAEHAGGVVSDVAQLATGDRVQLLDAGHAADCAPVEPGTRGTVARIERPGEALRVQLDDGRELVALFECLPVRLRVLGPAEL